MTERAVHFEVTEVIRGLPCSVRMDIAKSLATSGTAAVPGTVSNAQGEPASFGNLSRPTTSTVVKGLVQAQSAA